MFALLVCIDVFLRGEAFETGWRESLAWSVLAAAIFIGSRYYRPTAARAARCAVTPTPNADSTSSKLYQDGAGAVKHTAALATACICHIHKILLDNTCNRNILVPATTNDGARSTRSATIRHGSPFQHLGGCVCR
jgi:hypothetical protein